MVVVVGVAVAVEDAMAVEQLGFVLMLPQEISFGVVCVDKLLLLLVLLFPLPFVDADDDDDVALLVVLLVAQLLLEVLVEVVDGGGAVEVLVVVLVP